MRVRKSVIAIAALILAVAGAVQAQVETTRLSGSHVAVQGKVLVESADRTRTPVPGALVEIYSIDWNKHWTVKTDKNGRYVLSLPDTGSYLIVISGPRLTPMWDNNVHVGQTPGLDFVTYPGPGNRLSRDDVQGLRDRGMSRTVEEPAIEGVHTTVTLAFSEQDRAEYFSSLNRRLAAFNGLRALKEESDAARDNYNLGVSLKAGGEYERSLQEFENLFAGYGDSTDNYFRKIADFCVVNMSEAHYLMALEFYEKGHNDESKEHFIKAVDFGKQYLDRISRLRIVDEESKDYILIANRIIANSSLDCVKFLKLMEFKDTAMEAADRGAVMEQDHKAVWVLIKARTLSAAGEREAAIESYKSVIFLDYKSLDALYELSLVLLQSESQEDIKLAGEFLQSFIKLAPETDDRVEAAKQAVQSLGADQK